MCFYCDILLVLTYGIIIHTCCVFIICIIFVGTYKRYIKIKQIIDTYVTNRYIKEIIKAILIGCLIFIISILLLYIERYMIMSFGASLIQTIMEQLRHSNPQTHRFKQALLLSLQEILNQLEVRSNQLNQSQLLQTTLEKIEL